MKYGIVICVLGLALRAQDVTVQRAPLRLSMKRAVELATSPEGNANIQLAGESVKQAQSRGGQARAALLPGLDAAVTQENQTRNLAALGISGISLPFPGFQFPTFVGPFNVFDARLSGSQSIFDFSSIRRLQASRVGVKAARSNESSTVDQVSAQVAKGYLAALRSQADLETAQSNVDLAQALLKQAENQKAAGTGTGIEVTRARVQLSNERQRLLVATDARRRARLELLRAMGLRLDTEVELTDKLAYIPVDAITLEQARAEALKSRSDLAAQQEREGNARLSASATRMERVPTVAAFGDYGPSGSGINNSLPTRTYGISVRVPLFDGGRRDARRAEANSQYRQEHIRSADLKEQIELDVRLALDTLRSAEEQVKVAQEGLGLAENELAQARRRYDAGVANGVEVTDAQTRLERARDNQVDALFNYNQARIDLGQAMGTIRRMLQ
jgi:outer membrane protein TolC